MSKPVWKFSPPVSAAEIAALEAKWPRRFPEQYLEFLRRNNGATPVFVRFWSAEEVLEDGYRAEEFGPHLTFFGSDGCGELFAFDAREPVGHVTMVHSVSNWLEDTMLVARTFEAFVRRAERLAGDETYSMFDPIDS